MKTPAFAKGTAAQVLKGIENGTISYPTYIFIEDTNEFAFLDKNNMLKIVTNSELANSISQLTTKITELEDAVDKDDLVDEQGEPVTVAEYVKDKTEPLNESVQTVTEELEIIKSNGAVVMLTTDNENGGE